MKYKLLLFGLLFLFFQDIKAQKSFTRDDSVKIQKWFDVSISRIKDTILDMIPCVGDSYTVMMVPEKKQLDKIDIGLYYPDDEDAMVDKKQIKWWKLIRKSGDGFVYRGLSATCNTALKSRGDSLVFGQITWTAQVFYGEYKKIELPSDGNGFNLVIERKNSKRALYYDIMGSECFPDSATGKDTYHFFLPVSLSNVKKYQLKISEIGGDISEYDGPEKFELAMLEAADWDTVTVESTPEGCTIYKIKVADFGEYQDFFKAIENNNNVLTEADLKWLNTKCYVMQSPTYAKVPLRGEVSYYFYIRHGMKLSPRLPVEPCKGCPNFANYKF